MYLTHLPSVLLSALLYLQHSSARFIFPSDTNIDPVPSTGKVGDTIQSLNATGQDYQLNFPGTRSGYDALNMAKAKIERRQNRPLTHEQQLAESAALADALVPTLARADCFFVTTARLLHEHPQQFSDSINVPIPKPEDIGVGMGVMLHAFAQRRLHFHTRSTAGGEISPGGGPTRINRPNRPNRPDPYRNGLPEDFPITEGDRIPATVGVVYFRPGGGGHVVVGRHVGRSYARYRDYQADPNGADVTQDVRNGRIILIYWPDNENNAGAPFAAYRPEWEPTQVDADGDELMRGGEYGACQAPGDPGCQQPDNGEPIVVLGQNVNLGVNPDTFTQGYPQPVQVAPLGEDQRQRLLEGNFAGLNCPDIYAQVRGANSRYDSSGPGSSMRARDDQKDCEKAREILQKTPIDRCDTVKDLEFGFQLHDEWTAGTDDRIQAILIGPSGQTKVQIADAPDRGFHEWLPVDVKAFGSDTLDLQKAFTKVELTAAGIALGGIRNDEFKVQGFEFRGRCVETGYDVIVDKFASLNQWYHRESPYITTEEQNKEAQTVATFEVTRGDWHMKPPCTYINELKIDFRVADSPLAGTYDSLSLDLGGKETIPLRNDPDRALVVSKAIDLKKVFNIDDVAVHDLKSIRLIDTPADSFLTKDAWRFKGITLKAQCAASNTWMEMSKYSDVNKWVEYPNGDDQSKSVWSGDVIPGDWREV